ncbi:unnamed protein product [Rodentolepis nana]|uniref:Uncharacterized protein n=1 Tax=Rodentolepis nana TaxID=102285 RepID=A0A0R3TFC5_RODNA|nr:unnamed protein product [Rodentolepis nana]
MAALLIIFNYLLILKYLFPVRKKSQSPSKVLKPISMNPSTNSTIIDVWVTSGIFVFH